MVDDHSVEGLLLLEHRGDNPADGGGKPATEAGLVVRRRDLPEGVERRELMDVRIGRRLRQTGRQLLECGIELRQGVVIGPVSGGALRLQALEIVGAFRHAISARRVLREGYWPSRTACGEYGPPGAQDVRPARRISWPRPWPPDPGRRQLPCSSAHRRRRAPLRTRRLTRCRRPRRR